MRKGKLSRTLGLTEVVFFGVGSILGAGIYTIIGKVANFGGNMTWLSFLIAAFTAAMSIFSYAELSSMFPKASGEYAYVKNAANKKTAAFIGFVISANGIVSGGTVAIAFAGYFTGLFDVPLVIASVGVILFALVVNALGIRHSSFTNIALTAVEICGLLLVIYVAAPSIGNVDLLETPDGGPNFILLGSALSFFAFIGFEEIVKLSEETKNPTRIIPAALFIAAVIVTTVYVAIAVSVVNVMPLQELSASERPLADVVGSEWGSIGITVIASVALFSTTNTILANMTGSSRVLMGIGQDNKRLSLLTFVWESRKTPVVGLLICAVIMSVLASVARLEIVALVANFFVFLTFLAVNISAITLRVTKPEIDRPFRIPINIVNVPLPSVLGVLMTLILFGYTIYGLISLGTGSL